MKKFKILDWKKKATDRQLEEVHRGGKDSRRAVGADKEKKKTTKIKLLIEIKVDNFFFFAVLCKVNFYPYYIANVPCVLSYNNNNNNSDDNNINKNSRYISPLRA